MNGAIVWHRGRIWTGRRYVGRVIAEDGRVIAADDGGPGGPEVPTGADRIDLGGRLALPAFLDAHLHVTESARRPAGIDLRGARNFDEIAERVSRTAALSPSDAALWGGGWDEERLAERRAPTRRDLDRWGDDRPMVLTRVCEHVAVASTAALDALGISARTPDEEGGTIERDPDGSPSGVLRERALAHLERFPYPSLRDRPELGERFLAETAAAGLAVIAGLRAGPEEVAWWTGRSERGGAVPSPDYLAFGAVTRPEDIEAWARRRDSGATCVRGIKLFADGSFGGRGAWLSTPYADAPSTAGAPLLSPSEWAPRIAEADGAGLRVAAHALGDRAIAAVLEGVEAARPRRRVRIEHAGLVPDGLLGRLRGAGVDLVVQPGFRTSDVWLTQRLGADRARAAYRFASFRERGIPVAGSSDAPVEPFDPLEGIRSAVRLGEAVGEPLGPEAALELYLGGAAKVLERPASGHLEPGAEASLVVFEARRLAEILSPGPSLARTVWIRGARGPRAPGTAADNR